ncbi:twin-arginine translocation signal domain-containing protein [Ramlibacter sp.]|uniref:twin-arginine translocation signal domain-containing protein n=1 Tax=Ramlibacter sp. TaxID=1917967 RepID=UPI003D0F34D7
MTTRRSFLAGILAAGVAPAAVGSGILMPVRKIVMPGDVLWRLPRDVLDAAYVLRIRPGGYVAGFGLAYVGPN